MKLLTSVFVSRVTSCRHYAKGKPRMRILTYVPWRSQEACDNLKTTLSTPYEQMIPSKQVGRTPEMDPTNHTLADVGKFYTVPETITKHHFLLGAFPKKHEILNNIFNESCIMIRKPALEIIDYIKRADYSKLPVKYVMYGPEGCGKSISLVHVLHYAIVNKFITLHIPIASYLHKWGRKEANFSETREGLIDLPLEGALLLKRFQLQNADLVTALELKTTKEYVWNLRESLPAGSPLMSLVLHGINRVKYSCDALEGLISELKQAATAGKCKLFVAINGYNAFYSEKTMIRVKEQHGFTTEQLSIMHSYWSLLNPDWCNGAFLATICEKATLPEYRGSHMPFNLLRRKAFEDLDPFVPVYVPELSELEFHNLLDYYEDRRWLQKPGGREEIEFLTTRKPVEVRDYCAPL